MVGCVLVAVIAYIALQLFIGTIYWLLRTIVVILVIGGLLTLYLKLKSPRP